MSASFEQVYAELEQEHLRLMALIRRIRGAAGTIGLAPLLDELHALLIGHFSREQFPGGLYERMGAYGSRYHDELRVLVRDHCEILSAVRGLVDQVNAAHSHDAASLVGDVAAVLNRLHDHEQREHALAEKLLEQSG